MVARVSSIVDERQLDKKKKEKQKGKTKAKKKQKAEMSYGPLVFSPYQPIGQTATASTMDSILRALA